MQGYQHLSRDERAQIEVMLRQELSLREIADALDRSPSTISRELQRNGTGDGEYQAERAQTRAQSRARGRPPNGVEERSLALVRGGLARLEEGLLLLGTSGAIGDETSSELRDVASALVAMSAQIRLHCARTNESGVVPAVGVTPVAESGKRSA